MAHDRQRDAVGVNRENSYIFLWQFPQVGENVRSIGVACYSLDSDAGAAGFDERGARGEDAGLNFDGRLYGGGGLYVPIPAGGPLPSLIVSGSIG